MPNKLLAVEKTEGSWNGTRYIFFRCQRIIRVPPLGSLPGYERRCGGDASYLVIQEGELTGRKFELFLCEEHGKPYAEAWERMNDETKTEL